MNPKRILVVQLARMGDILQTLPLLRRLRGLHPQARLEVLTDRVGPEVLAGCPEVDEVIPLDLTDLHYTLKSGYRQAYAAVAAGVRDLQRRGYDEVFNINYSRLTLLLSYLTGAPRVRGYQPAAGGRRFLRDPWLAYIYSLVHARQYNRLNLADVFRWLAPGQDRPLAGEEQATAVRGAPAGTPPTFALQLGSRHPRRRWPVESFTELARRLLQEADARLVLLGTADESHLGRRLLSALNPGERQRVENLQGKTSLAELRRRLRHSSLLITGDTGTMHLAAAERTRVLALFLGPAQCFETGPYGAGHYVLQAEPDCHPCAEAQDCPQEHACARMIAPETAAAVARRLTASPGGPWDDVLNRPGVQLYHSTFDALGLSLQPVALRVWRFADLMALAYREAGKVLLGLQPARLPVNGLYAPPQGRGARRLRQQVGEVLQELHTGSPAASGEPAAALRPLKVFTREMAAHGDEGRKVAAYLRRGLQEWVDSLP